MEFTMRELVKEAGIKDKTVMYAVLCRPEYSHIKKIKHGKNVTYTNVYPLDILKLKTFLNRTGKREVIEEKMKAYKLLCALPIEAKEEFVTNYLQKYCKI